VIVVNHRNRNRKRTSSVAALVAGALLTITGCGPGPLGPDSWREHIPEEDLREVEQLADATLIVSRSQGVPADLQLEAATTYLLLVNRDGYDEVDASECVIEADPAIEVQDVAQSAFNYPYDSTTFFTFGEFTTDEAILTVIDCDASGTTIVAVPEHETV